MTTSEEWAERLGLGECAVTSYDAGLNLKTVTLGHHQWQMIRMMLDFHDGDPDTLEPLGCTEVEWNDLRRKFGFPS